MSLEWLKWKTPAPVWSVTLVQIAQLVRFLQLFSRKQLETENKKTNRWSGCQPEPGTEGRKGRREKDGRDPSED